MENLPTLSVPGTQFPSLEAMDVLCIVLLALLYAYKSRYVDLFYIYFCLRDTHCSTYVLLLSLKKKEKSPGDHPGWYIKICAILSRACMVFHCVGVDHLAFNLTCPTGCLGGSPVFLLFSIFCNMDDAVTNSFVPSWFSPCTCKISPQKEGDRAKGMRICHLIELNCPLVSFPTRKI